MNKEENLKRLFNLARNENLYWVKSHIILYPEDIDSQDNKWMTFLMFAAKLWNKKILDFLKFKWANLELTNKSWMTALMYSITYYNKTHQDIDVVESLISEKTLNLEDKNWITPLMLARRFEHENVCKFLIEYGAIEK